MKAILPVAGYANRFGEITTYTPKQLLPVAGIPILDYTLDQIERMDEIDSVYLVSNDRFFNDFANHMTRREWRQIGASNGKMKHVGIVNDLSTSNGNRLGTIRDIKLAIEILELESDIMVVFPDNLFDFRLEDALRSFIRLDSQYPVLVAYDVRSRERARNFGVLSVEEGLQNRIMDFAEKPHEPKSTLCSTGIYFFPKKSLGMFSRYLSIEGSNGDAMGHFMEWLVHEDRVFAHVYDSSMWRWRDIGTPEAYVEACRTWSNRAT